MSGYYTISELKEMGITVHGNNVLVSNLTRIYNPKNLILHNNIRIDDFTIISCKGLVEIFNYVHIASNVLLSCSTKIILNDYTGISAGVKVFGGSDDYTGKFMTNPTVPSEFTSVKKGDIILEKHALVGANSVILPGVTLKEGTSVGALTLVHKSTEEWKIYSGMPMKILKDRSKDCLIYEKKLKNKFF